MVKNTDDNQKVSSGEEESRLTYEKPEDEAPKRRGRPPKTEPEDYLRQYQYRKQTPYGSLLSDPVPGSKAEKMKYNLLRQPRVRTMIPRPLGEHKSILHSITLNGYRLDFPKNTYFDLPSQIAEIFVNSLQLTDAALEQFKIDPDKVGDKGVTYGQALL